MTLLFQILDIICAIALFIFAFFAVTSGVTKEPVVAVLVVLLFYSSVRTLLRAKKAY